MACRSNYSFEKMVRRDKYSFEKMAKRCIIRTNKEKVYDFKEKNNRRFKIMEK